MTDIRYVQTALRKDGFDIHIDGSYGPATKNLVRLFQKRYNLTVDGLVGPQTKSKLDDITSRKFTRYEYDRQTTYFVFNKKDIEKIDIINSVGKVETAKSMFKRVKPATLSNGGLFDMDTGSTGHYFFDEGKRQGYNAYSPFAFCIFNDGTMGFRDVTKDPANLKDAIGFSPSLVINEKQNMNTKNLSTSFIKGNAPRHAFMETDKHCIEIFVRGRDPIKGFYGVSLYTLSNICLQIGSKFGGCLNAGALDGGGSINMIIEGTDVISNYSRPLDNSITIYTRG